MNIPIYLLDRCTIRNCKVDPQIHGFQRLDVLCYNVVIEIGWMVRINPQWEIPHPRLIGYVGINSKCNIYVSIVFHSTTQCRRSGVCRNHDVCIWERIVTFDIESIFRNSFYSKEDKSIQMDSLGRNG